MENRLPAEEPSGEPDRRPTAQHNRDFCAVCSLPGEVRGRQAQKGAKKKKKADAQAVGATKPDQEKSCFLPADRQTGQTARTAKPTSSFWPVTGFLRSGGFAGQMAHQKGAVGATKPVKEKSWFCWRAWCLARRDGGSAVAVGATKPVKEKSWFPAGQPEEQAANTPRPLNFFPLGLPDAAKQGRQDKGKKISANAGRAKWAWTQNPRLLP